MHPVIKGQLSDFVIQNKLTESEDTNFELYTIYAIISGLLKEEVNFFDVHLKGKEFGLDGVCITVQGILCRTLDEVSDAFENVHNPEVELSFFQSKRSSSFDYGSVSKFFDGVLGFIEGDLAGESDQLDDFFAAFNEIYNRSLARNPRINLFYVTTGNYEAPNRVENLRKNTEEKLESLHLFSEVRIEFVGSGALQELYRAAQSTAKVKINFPRCMTLPKIPSVDQAYIGYVAASEILKLSTSDSEFNESSEINRTVFFDNVRDFDAESKLNLSMIEELSSNNSDISGGFVFRNNGVTVVAESINRQGDDFTLDNYQIVNGCQTSHVIFRCRDAVGDVFVPLKLIGSKDDSFVSSVIVGTNKQNPVRDEQFWALRPFLKNLEEFCNSQSPQEMIHIERRENQYRGQTVERVRIIKPRDLMKIVAAMFLFQPHRAARDYRGIREEFGEKLFQADHDVRLYHAAAIASNRIEFLFRNGKLSQDLKIFKYYILCALGFLATEGDSIFGKRSQQIEAAVRKIRDMIDDDDGFVNFSERYGDVLRKLINDSKLTEREKIRDRIRAESFRDDFLTKSELKKIKP